MDVDHRRNRSRLCCVPMGNAFKRVALTESEPMLRYVSLRYARFVLSVLTSCCAKCAMPPLGTLLFRSNLSGFLAAGCRSVGHQIILTSRPASSRI